MLARYRKELVPGSYLAISHISADDPDVDMDGLADATKSATVSAHPRTRAEVTALFGDALLVPPGLVWVGGWHPEPGSAEPVPGILGGLGRLG